MKLHVRRDQANRLLGGAKFFLEAKLELSEEEDRLIRKYQVGNEVVHARGRTVFDMGTTTISDLARGKKFNLNNFLEILELEDALRQGCEFIKTCIEMMKGFGGEVVYEFGEETYEFQ